MPKPTVETMDGFDPAELEALDDQALPGAAAEPDKEEKPEKKPAVDPAIAELRRLVRQQSRENQRLTATLADLAKGGGNAPKREKAAEAEPDLRLSVDLTEAITENDPKKIKAALAELGMMDRKQVEALLREQSEGLRKDAQMFQQYPELADAKSDFSRLANQIYQELEGENPELAGSKSLLQLALRQARREFDSGARPAAAAAVKSRGRSVAADDEDEDEESDEREHERVRRVERQAGDGTRRRTREGSGGDGRSEELSPMQRRIVDQLQAAGAKITYEAYAKRAAAGINMSAGRRR